MPIATGSFDAMIEELSAQQLPGKNTWGLSFRREFFGDVCGVSEGWIIGSGTPPVHGNTSSGHVGIEEFSGTIAGRNGSFAFQHWVSAIRGKEFSRIEVVPGSGTDQLKKIKGVLTLIVKPNAASYNFDYEL